MDNTKVTEMTVRTNAAERVAVTLPPDGFFVSDLGAHRIVTFSTPSGPSFKEEKLEKVAKAPDPGQYAFDPSTCSYLFAAAEFGRDVQIRYTYGHHWSLGLPAPGEQIATPAPVDPMQARLPADPSRCDSGFVRSDSGFVRIPHGSEHSGAL